MSTSLDHFDGLRSVERKNKADLAKILFKLVVKKDNRIICNLYSILLPDLICGLHVRRHFFGVILGEKFKINNESESRLTVPRKNGECCV